MMAVANAYTLMENCVLVPSHSIILVRGNVDSPLIKFGYVTWINVMCQLQAHVIDHGPWHIYRTNNLCLKTNLASMFMTFKF